MTHNKNNHFKKSSLSKQTRNLTFVLCMGMLAGVLIWAKLRLVTDIPRSAYAEPRELDLQDPGFDQSDDDQKTLDDSTSEDRDESEFDSISTQIILKDQTHIP